MSSVQNELGADATASARMAAESCHGIYELITATSLTESFVKGDEHSDSALDSRTEGDRTQ